MASSESSSNGSSSSESGRSSSGSSTSSEDADLRWARGVSWQPCAPQPTADGPAFGSGEGPSGPRAALAAVPSDGMRCVPPPKHPPTPLNESELAVQGPGTPGGPPPVSSREETSIGEHSVLHDGPRTPVRGERTPPNQGPHPQILMHVPPTSPLGEPTRAGLQATAEAMARSARACSASEGGPPGSASSSGPEEDHRVAMRYWAAHALYRADCETARSELLQSFKRARVHMEAREYREAQDWIDVCVDQTRSLEQVLEIGQRYFTA